MKTPSNSAFQLLGVKVLEGCSPSIRKLLKVGETYLLTTEYQLDSQNECNLIYVGTENRIAGCMYDVRGTDGSIIGINIQAIVGKNGDGKSSIVELILRIINNFAIDSGFIDDHDTLTRIDGLHAILYFHVKGVVYAIVCDGKNITSIYRDGQVATPFTEADSVMLRKKKLKMAFKDNLFYTLVVNYSLYSYNSVILDKEVVSGSWIDPLFHKNDSYQTPIVLNPMRTRGNIDINREEDLARQRLMALYTYSGGNESSCRISSTQWAKGFVFNLVEESKLKKITIRKYFRDVRPYHLAWVEFEREVRYRESQGVMLHDSFPSTMRHYCEFWESFAKWYQQMPNLDQFLRTEDKYYEYNHNDKSDVVDYHTRIKSLWATNEHSGVLTSAIKYVDVFTRQVEWISYAQMYRLLAIQTVWDALAHSCPKCKMGNLDDSLGKKHDPVAEAKMYLVYKVIDALQTYKPFCDDDHTVDNTFSLYNSSIDDNPNLNALKLDVNKLLGEGSYITLKIRQTLSYLCRRNTAMDSVIKRLRWTLHPIMLDPSEERSCVQGFEYFIGFDKLKHLINPNSASVRLSDVMVELPPPIFEGEIVVEDVTGECYPMGYLSSGQTQMIYSVSSIGYHLRNLDFDVADQKIQYRNICIILEEVELYFHPEYQRRYVDELLRQIERCELKNICYVNICLVTHSPFVLSDVMRRNTLYLKKGESVTNQMSETFGANLYDLMQDSFFLEENAIGKVSSTFMKRLIDRKNKGEEIYMDELSIVGDPLIHHYLE